MLSFLQLFITRNRRRIQKWLPKRSHFYFNLQSTSLELFISAPTTTSSQDLWEPIRAAVQRSQCIVRAQNAFRVFLTLLHAIYQYTAGTSQAFNSIESFSWYKLLSFTVSFNILSTGLVVLKLLTNTFLRGHYSFHFCYISCHALYFTNCESINCSFLILSPKKPYM